jgi:hypothetical protein
MQMNNENVDNCVNPWADLVIAMLSVNNYPLTKVCKLYDALKANGLFDPRNLACWSCEDIAGRLGAAGYDRGAVLTAFFTDRLSSLGRLADELEVNERILTKGTRTEVAELLRRVKGVGPKVLKDFFTLRG